MLRGLQGWHLIIVVVLFVVLFGAKKLPDSAKSIAKSLKIFKQLKIIPNPRYNLMGKLINCVFKNLKANIKI